MPQHFPPNSNAFAKWSIVGGLVFVIVLVTVLAIFARVSNYRVGVPVAQPVAFSHALHAGELGLDCRYCHNTVEVAAFANIPSTETCMTCHSQVRAGTPQLAPIWQSWESGVPVQWHRVHNSPDFVYFNHSAHVNKGIGCSECHGRVDQMAQIWKAEEMSMGWCLDCHRDPARYVRPREEVFNLAYERPANQLELGASLVRSYHINTQKLPDCWVCHR